MSDFIVKSVNDGRTLCFSGIQSEGEGYVGYRVRLSGGNVTAETGALDLAPEGWVKFFHDLARNWRGWIGAKSCASLEGDVSLSCTCDSLGHVSVRVKLAGTDWQAEDTLVLEVGALETLAKTSAKFFGRVSGERTAI